MIHAVVMAVMLSTYFLACLIILGIGMICKQIEPKEKTLGGCLFLWVLFTAVWVIGTILVSSPW